jgi:hypothetical protein
LPDDFDPSLPLNPIVRDPLKWKPVKRKITHQNMNDDRALSVSIDSVKTDRDLGGTLRAAIGQGGLHDTWTHMLLNATSISRRKATVLSPSLAAT